MNIVVLAGGLSPERDVSLSSGTKACEAFRKNGHNAILVDLFMGVDSLPSPVSDAFTTLTALPPRSVSETAPDLAKVRASRADGFSPNIGNGVVELCHAADITYLALHGDDGENGRLQAFFDMMGIRYTGSGYLGCAVAMHKWVTKQLLIGASVLTPRGVLLHPGERPDLSEFPLPLVIKPCCGGSSIGIAIARTEEELDAALADAFRYENEVLAEEYISGKELTCGVLGDVALPLVEIIPKEGFYDYAHKYQAGWTEEICPARLDPAITLRIQEAALAAYRALHLEVYGRVDFLLADDGSFYCLEANTLPGMTPTSLLPQEAAAVGVDYPALCDKIVALSLRKYKK